MKWIVRNAVKPCLLGLSFLSLMLSNAQAATPIWSLEPLTSTSLSVPANTTAEVQYRVTNLSKKPRSLVLTPIQGVAQVTTGVNVCRNPIVIDANGGSCTLRLQITGSQLSETIQDGPMLCQDGSPHQCYSPGKIHRLHIEQAPPILDVVITAAGSPLTLVANGPAAQLTITNTSTILSATNIQSNFTGTALDGNVTETGNTCANVAPGGTCTLTYTPGLTNVAQTDFIIKGSNTYELTAAIVIQPPSLSSINPTSGASSGGTSFTLTGTGLTGATGVTFGGVAATSVNVVDSTTVTGVTPAHASGAVDVVITTPTGNLTLTNGYTYAAPAIGNSLGGGKVACLNGGLNNLIAASSDNSTGIRWGSNTVVGGGAQSITDGATNTLVIVAALANDGGIPYAAKLCNDYEVDSQGNTPCQAGNTCYNDWFLPAGNNVTATGQLNCLYVNRAAIGGFSTAYYWSSTEDSGNPGSRAWNKRFLNAFEFNDFKSINVHRVRCVREFTP